MSYRGHYNLVPIGKAGVEERVKDTLKFIASERRNPERNPHGDLWGQAWDIGFNDALALIQQRLTPTENEKS